jgi:hypothetical protein
LSDAKITVGADSSGVDKALAVSLSFLKNFAGEAKSAISGAITSIASDLSNVALAQGKVNFSSQHTQVRDWEASSARMAISVGRDLQQLRGESEAVGLSLGKRPGEVVAWSSEVGKLTGNFSGAMQGMKGISELAAGTNRTAQEYRGLAVELAQVGKISGDTSGAVALLKQQADSLGVSGGVASFADQVQGLSDAFSYFAVKGEQDFGKMTEMAAKLGGGGANQATAGRIQQGVLGNIAGNSFQWSRFLGRDIYDKEGNLEDPNKTIGDIVQKIEKTYKRPDQARRALILQFGAQAGSRLHRLHETGELYQSPKMASGGGPAPADALKQYLGTDAGKRDQAQAQLAVASDKLLGSSSALGIAADKLQAFAAGHPIASTVASTAAGGVISGVMGSAVKAVTGGGGGGTAAGLAVQGGARAIPIVGAGVAGFAAGWEMAGGQAEIDRQAQEETAKGYTPEQKHSLVVAKEMRDRIRAARGFPALKGGYVPSAEDTELARGVAQPGGREAFEGKLRAEGVSEQDARRIGQAVAEAMKSVNIQVQSTPDNPLSATVRTSQSSASGNQGGT